MQYTITKTNQYQENEKILKYTFPKYHYKLQVEYYNSLKKGNFIGDVISSNEEEQVTIYEYKFATSKVFEKVHGELKINYVVYHKDRLIRLIELETEYFFKNAKDGIINYKGCIVTKKNQEKDVYKINLITMLNKDE